MTTCIVKYDFNPTLWSSKELTFAIGVPSLKAFGAIVGPAILYKEDGENKFFAIGYGNKVSHDDVNEFASHDQETYNFRNEFCKYTEEFGFHTTNGFFVNRAQAFKIYSEMAKVLCIPQKFDKFKSGLFSYDLDISIIDQVCETYPAVTK